jgi:hypothetical protein
MKLANQAIPLLPSTTTDERIVKRSALATFRAIRYLADQAKKAPSVLQQAASDVRHAWEESSRPNA